MKKIGKNGIIAILIGLLMVSGASAVLLVKYGSITQNVEVDRSLTLTGNGCTDNVCTSTTTATGGETILSEEYTITSQTSVDVPASIDNTADEAGAAMITHYLLSAGSPQGTESRIRINAEDAGISTLSDLTSISFDQYVTAGYIGHVDVLVDTDGDGVKDDALVFEYDKISAPSDQTVANMNYARNTWVTSFDDKGSVSDTSKAWLSSGAPGPVGGAGFVYGTLADWKAGSVDASIDQDTAIVAFEFEVDSWIETSTEKMKNIRINGNVANILTAQSGKTINFQVSTEFANNAEGSYVLTTEVTPQ